MTVSEQIQQLALAGIGRRDAEAAIGHTFDDAELAAYRAARVRFELLERKRKLDKAKKTGADYVAAHISRRNEVGDIPPPENPARKEKCRMDLEAFGWHYCRALLRHRASADIRDGLIRDAQECVLNGGQTAELYARGGGKTTWIVIIASIWAILYGHRRFVVTIGASMLAAKKTLKTIKRFIARSPEIRADFPAVVIPIGKLGGISQRAASQTYRGQPTGIEWGAEQITMPTLRDGDGELLDAGCGGILAVTGVGGAIRGANEGGQRPDMLLFDDPQTRKAAMSPKLVEGILEFIHSDALGLAGHDSTIAAFLTITPQRYGDVATAILSRTRFPEWSVKVQSFIKRKPPNWDKLVTLFCEKYADDAAARDFKHTSSTEWYRQNRALFAEMETIDAEQYDHRREVDVCHHLLNLRAKMGKKAFDAEIMMKVEDVATDIPLTVDRVSNALNGAPQDVCPPGTDTVVGFCDINSTQGAGLSWALVAFGPRRTAAVIDRGRFPADGSALVPPNASSVVRDRTISAAMRTVIEQVAGRTIRDTRGRAVRIRAFGFDRGWLPEVVHRTLYVIRKRLPVGFPIAAMRGFPWNKFGTRESDMLRRGDHIFPTRSRFGEYLAFMAPYWREVMQRSILEGPLQPGSLSFWGNDPTVHHRMAEEVCAERLVRKYQVYTGKQTTVAWDWAEPTGPEHFCDALTGAFALASWFRAYDALSAIVDPAALGVKYDGAADATEGTCDTGTPRTKDDLDLERDMDVKPTAPLPPKIARRPVTFKRGRFRK